MLLGGEDAGTALRNDRTACGFASRGAATWQRYSRSTWERPISRSRCSIATAACATLCRIAPPIVAPRDGYMELPADAFGNVIVQGIAELRSRAGGDLSDVEAVTFATQTNSFVLLDAEDRPLTPLILWPDRRAAQLEEEVRRRCDIPGFSATTGFSRIELPVHGGEAALAARAIARDMEAGKQAVSDQRLLDASSDGQARDGSGRGGADRPGRYPSLPMVSRDAGSIRDRRASSAGDRPGGNRLGADRSAGRTTFRTAGLVPLCRRLSRPVCRGDRRGQRRTGHDFGDDRHRAGDGSMCRSVRRAARPRRASRAGLPGRTLLADGFRRGFGQLPRVVSRATAGSARLRSTDRLGGTDRTRRRGIEAENGCRIERVPKKSSTG